MFSENTFDRDVNLAPYTSLKLGGPAEFFTLATTSAELAFCEEYTRKKGMPLTILAGGSNMVISDAGVAGLVVHLSSQGIRFQKQGTSILATVSAGENWDAFVAEAVSRNLAGVECLSGIPGSVGATPIQNVGAYGQEVSDTIIAVRVIDRTSGETFDVPAQYCGFAYRHSRFKEHADQFVVTDVTFALSPNGSPIVRYGELQRRLESLEGSATLSRVREQVIALRRAKSMVIDETDPNHRSAGSFFTNPIVPIALAQEVVRRALRLGLAAESTQVPQYPSIEGHIKLAAGWLIEKSGLDKGLREGSVGISDKHALALVHHGGGTTRELLSFAQKIADHVQDVFGVTLEQEPQLVGRFG